MTQTEILINKRLISSEKLLGVVENLKFESFFAPGGNPENNFDPLYDASLALTTRRMIIIFVDHKGVIKWLNIQAINYLSERLLSQRQPSWPYQAIVMIPGGMGFVIQTNSTNEILATQLATLLTDAFMRFGVNIEDESAIAALIAHQIEEEKRRKQDN